MAAILGYGVLAFVVGVILFGIGQVIYGLVTKPKPLSDGTGRNDP